MFFSIDFIEVQCLSKISLFNVTKYFVVYGSVSIFPSKIAFLHEKLHFICRIGAKMAFARFNRRGNGEQQQQQAPRGFSFKADERVGEILSDSNSELSSVDGDDAAGKSPAPTKAAKAKQPDASRSSRASPSSGSSNGSGNASIGGNNNSSKMRTQRETSGGAKIRQLPAKSSPPPPAATASKIQSQSQSQARSARGMKKTGSRKWYSDSENEEDEDGGQAKSFKQQPQGRSQASKSQQQQQKKHSGDDEEEEVHSIEDDDSDLEKFITGSMAAKRNDTAPSPLAEDDIKKPKALRNLKTLNNPVNGPPGTQVISPSSESENTPHGGRNLSLDPLAKKKTGFQKLVAKTFSPFSSRRKSIESPAIETVNNSNNGDPPSASGRKKSQAMLSPSSDVTGSPANDSSRRGSIQTQHQQQTVATSGKRQSVTADVVSPLTNSKSSRSNSVNTNNAMTGSETTSGPLINRRTSRLKQSPNESELAGLSRSLGSPQDVAARRAYEAAAATASSGGTMSAGDALSPGQRKLAGAFLGTAGSGVVLEGWLRQKQRRGMKGMKKWNSRYFVLYAKTNEVRYYTDVVQSAWGPMPLGEIGSISLRLIQRIGKPSHPKYRGCRFDITCRNSWGTHYADDYVSSDEENSNNTNNNSNHNSMEDNAAKQQDRTSTPRSSRIYSLMADSPQTTVTWVNTLDSLLVRSANSPRPDVASNSSATATAGSTGTGGTNGSKLKRVPSSKAIARRRSSTMESETVVLVGTGENVPKPVTYAIHYIFESTPGIETELFYQQDPDPAKLKVCRCTRAITTIKCILN